jgi:hypothetical protein
MARMLRRLTFLNDPSSPDVQTPRVAAPFTVNPGDRLLRGNLLESNFFVIAPPADDLCQRIASALCDEFFLRLKLEQTRLHLDYQLP